MSNVDTRLNPLDLAIKDGFLIYLIFNSLPKEFKTFEVNYNSMNDKWTLKKFIAMCVQEEDRIKRNNGGIDKIKCNNGGFDSVNMAKHHQKRENPPPQSLMLPRKKIKGKPWARAQINLWTGINACGARRGVTIRRIALNSWST
jgi:hypothetical protein